MARYTGPVCKKCRNEGAKLFLKGERCYSPKCSFDRRSYGSGQHGQARKKVSEFGLHLRAKQKVRHSYQVLEGQFSKYYEAASRKKGVTGTILLQLLESRLDNVVYKSGLVPSRRQSRQLVRHKHFLVNGRTVNIPSYRVKAGDVITVKAATSALVKELAEVSGLDSNVEWLTVDKTELKVTVNSLPERDQIDPSFKEQLIIEYYSK